VVPTAKIPFGSSVAVLVVGGVGLNAVQGAFASSAYPIIAVDLLDWKLEETKQFGATQGFVLTRNRRKRRLEKSR
jgi:Zn-dependent alcohol dehydrogenase|tara:strand:+ start:164 stop:388 length:225 start_codon:yes stop_codon:yes gene_type:complete